MPSAKHRGRDLAIAARELTQADVERMAEDIIAAARARLDVAAPPGQGPSADQELQATQARAKAELKRSGTQRARGKKKYS
jgi:hypothetical protein